MGDYAIDNFKHAEPTTNGSAPQPPVLKTDFPSLASLSCAYYRLLPPYLLYLVVVGVGHIQLTPLPVPGHGQGML